MNYTYNIVFLKNRVINSLPRPFWLLGIQYYGQYSRREDFFKQWKSKIRIFTKNRDTEDNRSMVAHDRNIILQTCRLREI